jgi:hypothetical protein
METENNTAPAPITPNDLARGVLKKMQQHLFTAEQKVETSRAIRVLIDGEITEEIEKLTAAKNQL